MSASFRARCGPPRALPGSRRRATPRTTADIARARATLLEVSWRSAFSLGLTRRIVQASGGEMAALADQPVPWVRSRVRSRPAPTPMPSTCPGAGHAVITWIDDAYPPRLRQLTDPPPALFVRGDLRSLERLAIEPLVAVVGARSPSRYGLEMAERIAAGLARAGVGIVSGLALGIDAAAHRGALAALPRAGERDTTTSGKRGRREPATPVHHRDAAAGYSPPPLVGVLGCGVDVVHPRSNMALFDEVAARGLLLSEYWWDLPALAWRFPARNRIIAGLADAVIIVEGRRRSGARHTVDFAHQLGLEVLAVPGEAGRRLSELPNSLIRDGASMCESADDALAALAAIGRRPGAPSGTRDEAARQRSAATHRPPPWWAADSVESLLFEALADSERSVDELIEISGRPAAAVLGCLSRLEIDGIVVPGSGQRFRLVPTAEGALRPAAEVTP